MYLGLNEPGLTISSVKSNQLLTLLLSLIFLFAFKKSNKALEALLYCERREEKQPSAQKQI